MGLSISDRQSNFKSFLWIFGLVFAALIASYLAGMFSSVQISGLQWDCQPTACDVHFTVRNKKPDVIKAILFIDATKTFQMSLKKGFTLDRVGAKRLARLS